jgi:hypothetical protein
MRLLTTCSRSARQVWTPSIILLGDVGYHKRPQGSFVKLFNAFDPSGTATSYGKTIPPLGHVSSATQNEEQRSILKRGIDWVGGFLKSPMAKGGQASTKPREVSRKYDFRLRARHKRAMLVAEATKYVCS